MKLEFLAGGPPDNPLVRLHDFTQDDARQLRRIFYLLADGSLKTAILQDMSFIEAVCGCRLKLLVGTRDRGIHSTASNIFECTLTKLGWDNVGGLTDPFCESGSKGFQWLTEHGPIRLLISRNGEW
jgi:hypothetical protein